LSEAATAEGKGALNALDMDFSSCGFDRTRSRLAKIIKGVKKVAYYPDIWNSPQSLGIAGNMRRFVAQRAAEVAQRRAIFDAAVATPAP
jgi:hypothetical protein